ncbi:TetR/AcrR family transcriptional regulator [Microbacterium sp. 18062]|uniref:TetR/AcrR family transcriptional regulator n=1 Tax=Microbacterium sp. 18062 TaxID=2681410 RepID=UPI00135714EB|nr:TetR/AcrR family transcriptional regulator [Microbacterium sp. 18062]
MPRLPGSTKDAIAHAAVRLFAEHGYARTSLRMIAAEVGVDAALVIRHFGSKERLFVDSMRLDLTFQEVLDGPVEDLGPRLVGFLLDADDRARGIFLALLRASDVGEIESVLRTTHENEFVAPLRRRLPGVDADLRARLAAAMVAGLMYSLWVVGDEEVAEGQREVVVLRYGAILQSLLTS